MTAQAINRMRKTKSEAQGSRPKWLSHPEASELCTLSVHSLKRLTQAGRHPATSSAARCSGSRRPTWRR